MRDRQASALPILQLTGKLAATQTVLVVKTRTSFQLLTV